MHLYTIKIYKKVMITMLLNQDLYLNIPLFPSGNMKCSLLARSNTNVGPRVTGEQGHRKAWGHKVRHSFNAVWIIAITIMAIIVFVITIAVTLTTIIIIINNQEKDNWPVISWFKDKENVFTLISIRLAVSLHKTKKKSSNCSITWTDFVSFFCELYVLFPLCHRQ